MQVWDEERNITHFMNCSLCVTLYTEEDPRATTTNDAVKVARQWTKKSMIWLFTMITILFKSLNKIFYLNFI